MTQMIERVARTIQEVTPGGEFIPWDDALNTARCLIAAMREPTDEQRNAYYELSFKTEVMFDAHWERAIDAALKVSEDA